MKIIKWKYDSKWQTLILPSIRIYVESHSPNDHKRFWKDGIVGLYIQFEWLQWSYIFGVTKNK